MFEELYIVLNELPPGFDLCAFSFYLNMFCFLLQSCAIFFGHKITWLIKSQPPEEADQQYTVLLY